MEKTNFSSFMESLYHMTDSLSAMREREDNLGCVDGGIIGTGRPDFTRSPSEYKLNIKGKDFLLIDVPGIEGDESKFEDIIKRSLEKAHAVFYVNGEGKKIEKNSLEKIKKYMRDSISLYAIFNVHCKAKKERIPDIDPTYKEELRAAYKRHEKIAQQTEAELKPFLGESFKGRMLVNGILGFCSLAINKTGRTTIIDDKEKKLRSEQKKYLKEYSFDRKAMAEDSRIYPLCHIINQRLDSYEREIYEENLKKLTSRMENMLKKIEELRQIESKKIQEFTDCYNSFQDNCREARDAFKDSLDSMGETAVSNAFESVRDDLFDMLENSGGKIKKADIKGYFDSKEKKLIQEIENNVNKGVEDAYKEYNASIKEAERRLIKDFERAEATLKIKLPNSSINVSTSFRKELEYNIKDFGDHAMKVGGLAFSFGAAGVAFGGVGIAIGAAIGALVGVIMSVWSFFTSKEKKIARAKGKLNKALNEQINKIAYDIQNQLDNMGLMKEVDKSLKLICSSAEEQKKKLSYINNMLNNISRGLHVSSSDFTEGRK